MSWFRVRVLGENYHLHVEGKPRCVGFYAVRFIEATDAEVAEAEAINQVRFEPRLQKGLLNAESDPPKLSVEELEEVSRNLVPETVPGLLFFPSDT